MQPFLSVVTINRNNAAGLRGTIESVLTQTGLNAGELEYIIIDGASNDGSADVIKEYAARNDMAHKVAYWVSEKDKGIYNAMNKGIRAAHGEYVAILNSGDCYVRGALKGLKEAASEHKGAILYGAVNFIRDGRYEQVWGKSADYLPGHPIPHQATFVPMTAYDACGLYDESFKVSADWDLFATFKQKGVPFFYLSKLIADFDISGVSGVRDTAREAEDTRVLERHGLVLSVKKPFVKRIRQLLKLFIPYGLMIVVWRMQDARYKKRKGA